LLPLPFTHPVYAAIFWSVYSFWFVLEIISSIVKRSKDRSNVHDKSSYIVIMVSLGIALGLAFALSTVLPQASIRTARASLFYVGIILMLAGIAFRFYSMSLLGRSFTYGVTVRPDQPIVEAGPYRYIRHPSYTGALITLAGVGLALGNWASLLALLACMGAAYGYRMSVEEASLVSVLGKPYVEYMRRTRRLVPFVF
jgi:protein-S-isoprenylcysteine O-methyltransferase Ste14